MLNVSDFCCKHRQESIQYIAVPLVLFGTQKEIDVFSLESFYKAFCLRIVMEGNSLPAHGLNGKIAFPPKLDRITFPLTGPLLSQLTHLGNLKPKKAGCVMSFHAPRQYGFFSFAFRDLQVV